MKNTIIGIGLILLSIIGIYALAWMSYNFDVDKHWYATPTVFLTIIGVGVSFSGAFYILAEKPFKTDKG
jgi:hypothetical protein